MFSIETYESIKQRVLSNISTSVDKREGSIINDIISPLCLELAKAYVNFEEILNVAFLENNSFDMLDMKVREYGISRKEGTYATGQLIITGTQGTILTNGTLFLCGNLVFTMLNNISLSPTDNICYIVANEVGTQYNILAGSTFVLAESVIGIDSITCNTNLTGGTDLETDTELLERFYSYIQKQGTSGNKNDYYNWTMEIDGVGECKVYDTNDLNQSGTVKVIVCDGDRRAASQTLLDKVLTTLDSNRPVGATVIVESVVEIPITISAKLTLKDGYVLEEVANVIENSILSYLFDIAFNSNVVSYAKIGNTILETEGISDYEDYKLNGGIVNIILSDTNIPVIGTITFS